MDDARKDCLRLSGRLRALEQIMEVMMVDLALRSGPDPAYNIDQARKYAMLTVQTEERPIDPDSDFEADVMIDALDRLFANARAQFERNPGEG